MHIRFGCKITKKKLHLYKIIQEEANMKRFVFAILLSSLLSAALCQAAPSHKTIKFKGQEREYWISLPEGASSATPLVICLHGYGGKAEGYKPGFEKKALERGFAVCFPQGLKAPKGKTGWNVRYPKQEGMTSDDIAFVVFLSRQLPKLFSLSPENVFMAGMSNGGEMCYLMAYRCPKAFRAIASVAGLQMGWIKDELKPKGPVPFFEIHGTEDKTSRWEGDPDNQYGWGEYLPVPAAVANIVSINDCRLYSKTELPALPGTDKKVILHSYTRGAEDTEVAFYEVIGGTHSWAEDAVDTYGIIFDFFSRHLAGQF